MTECICGCGRPAGAGQRGLAHVCYMRLYRGGGVAALEARYPRKAVAAKADPWVCACCEMPKGPHTIRKGRSPVCEYCRASLARKGQRWCAHHGIVAETSKARCGLCNAACDRKRRQRPDVAERERERKRTPAYKARAAVYRRAYRERNRDRVRMWARQRAARLRSDPERYARMLEANRQSRARHVERYRAMWHAWRRRRLVSILRGAPRAR